jgi:hypothetical protein
VSGEGLQRLRALLREDGGLMASLLGAAEETPRDDGRPTPAAIAADGPRAAGRREEYELLIEAIFEGYLLHYGTPRVVVVGDDDLRLLAGDRLYAIGLARLVALGDTHAVSELADTITLSALAHGSGEAELAEAVWEAGAGAVGWGPCEAHAAAKDLLLAGDPRALDAMRTSAEATRGRAQSSIDIVSSGG